MQVTVQRPSMPPYRTNGTKLRNILPYLPSLLEDCERMLQRSAPDITPSQMPTWEEAEKILEEFVSSALATSDSVPSSSASPSLAQQGTNLPVDDVTHLPSVSPHGFHADVSNAGAPPSRPSSPNHQVSCVSFSSGFTLYPGQDESHLKTTSSVRYGGREPRLPDMLASSSSLAAHVPYVVSYTRILACNKKFRDLLASRDCTAPAQASNAAINAGTSQGVYRQGATVQMVPSSVQMRPKMRRSVYASIRSTVAPSSVSQTDNRTKFIQSYQRPVRSLLRYKMPYFGRGTMVPMDTMNIIYPTSSTSASLSMCANPDIAPVCPSLHLPLSSAMSPEANQSAAKRSVRWCDPIQPREGGGISVIHREAPTIQQWRLSNPKIIEDMQATIARLHV